MYQSIAIAVLALTSYFACFAIAEPPAGPYRVPGDTPNFLANPEGLRQHIDRLREQDHWTDFATPEQIRLFEGPQTDWPKIPRDRYNMEGVDLRVIGSEVPPPGVHPRILFSPQDLPAIRKKLATTRAWIETECVLQKTILNPESSDGQVFQKLASGDLEGLEFPDDGSRGANGNHRFNGYRIGIYAAHVCYWPRNLNAIGLYALIKDDDALGKRVADALVNYYRLREPLIDKQNARGTDPNAENAWPADTWRGMHYVAGEGHLGFAYDMTAMHMTDDQKEFMRKIIVKATAGKRSYGANAPIRWRDTNWAGWDTQHVLAHLAIEGQEGFEPELLSNLRDTVYGYLTWGISPYGTIFETNGKNRAGWQFAMCSLMAVARRGHSHLLGHPHLRKVAESQVHQVVPAGGRNNNNGTYGCGSFHEQSGFLKNIFPGNRSADWLIQSGDELAEAKDPEAYRDELMASRSLYRIHPLTADKIAGIASFKGADGKETWERDYLGLPLDYEDPHHGQMCVRSGNDRDALYMMIEARPDLYSTGHQHYDAGHFYLSAHGIDWGIEGNDGIRSSRFHSIVLIDGMGQGPQVHLGATRVDWLGSVMNEQAAFARTNLKHAYDYIWTTPMHYGWGHEDRTTRKWEPETHPDVVRVYKGTQRYKARIWMHSYWNWNWGPCMRAEFNKVEYAFRTAGIVRGKHPYALIVDDIRKDDHVRVYDWQMHIPDGIRHAAWWKMPEGLTVLAREEDVQKHTVRKDAPCLAVLILERDRVTRDKADIQLRRQLTTGTQALVISARTAEPRFKIALIPFRFGGPLPSVDFADGRAKIKWSSMDRKTKEETVSQVDEIEFERQNTGRTTFNISRDGRTVIDVD